MNPALRTQLVEKALQYGSGAQGSGTEETLEKDSDWNDKFNGTWGITSPRAPPVTVPVEPRVPSAHSGYAVYKIESPKQENEREPVFFLSERISAAERVLTHHAELRTDEEEQVADHEIRIEQMFRELVEDKLDKVARDVMQQHEQLGAMNVEIAEADAKHKKHIDVVGAKYKGHFNELSHAQTQLGATIFELEDSRKTSNQHVQQILASMETLEASTKADLSETDDQLQLVSIRLDTLNVVDKPNVAHTQDSEFVHESRAARSSESPGKTWAAFGAASATNFGSRQSGQSHDECNRHKCGPSQVEARVRAEHVPSWALPAAAPHDYRGPFPSPPPPPLRLHPKQQQRQQQQQQHR